MPSVRTVFRNACLEPFNSTSDTLVILDGLVEAVGSWGEVSNLVSGTDVVIDCAERTLIPGIEDSHLHGYMLGRQLSGVNLTPVNCPDLASIHRSLINYASKSEGWIRGFGWVSGAIAGGGPNGAWCHQDLEATALHRPIILTDFSGHQAWCNKIALDIAGITKNSPEPPGGVIVRDASGEPTGLLLESAVKLVTSSIPKPSKSELKSAIRTARDILLANGITSYTDPGIGPGAASLDDGSASLEVIDAYREMQEDKELKLRVDIMLLFGGLGGTTLEDVRKGLDDFGPPIRQTPSSHLSVAQLKLFADGIPRSRTAWLSEPYDNHDHGSLSLAGDTDAERVKTLESIYLHATNLGWQIGIHATGDQTVSAIADVAQKHGKAKELRNYVIHGDLIKPGDFKRLAEAGIGLSVQPAIRWMVGRNVEKILGAERSSKRLLLRQMKDAGINLALSSDGPVSPADWRVIFSTAVNRGFAVEPEFNDGQGLTPIEAMEALTTKAAFQSHSENWRGSLTKGKVADFMILDRKINWSDNPRIVLEAKPAAVFVGGSKVFGEI